MLFKETQLRGAYIIEPERLEDKRGFFARTFCHKEFEAQGLNFEVVQCNISFNREKGTLRGMHYQKTPHGEVKLVSCVRGAIFDVIIDLRPNSPTYYNFISVLLDQNNHKMIFIPKGFAHGFQTLENNTMVFYQMSEFYRAKYARGVRYNDPKFKIPWPNPKKIISEKDRNYPYIEKVNT